MTTHQPLGRMPSDTMAVPTMNGHCGQETGDAMLYASVFLSETLERQAETAQTLPTDDLCKDDKQDVVSTNIPAALENKIWVPAHKHPQINPSEFAVWIKTHEIDYFTKKRHVKRQKSKLSSSLTFDDNQSDGQVSPTTPNDMDSDTAWGTQGITTKAQAADPFLTTKDDDDSPILVSREHRALSRRSAFSARGHARTTSLGTDDGVSEKRKRRSAPRPRRHASTATAPISTPPEGVTLYDRPVSISEWVDLGIVAGNADSECSMLSRVQDAESHLFAPSTIPAERTKPLLQRVQSKRLSLVLPSSGWLTGLFQEKKKSEPNTKRFDFRTIIPRSLSLRSKKTSRPRTATAADQVSTAASAPAANAAPTVASASSGTKIKLNTHRLPIHTERAMYRLSHIKLANPKRPLRHQVLISNFMFWYLSIMNPQDNPSQTGLQPPQTHEKLPSPLATALCKFKSVHGQPAPWRRVAFRHHGRHQGDNHGGVHQEQHSANKEDEDSIPLSFYSNT